MNITNETLYNYNVEYDDPNYIISKLQDLIEEENKSLASICFFFLFRPNLGKA